MNMSTFCEIKYMNMLFFKKTGYMIGVGFKILTCTPYQNYHEIPTPLPEFKTFQFCLCKLCTIVFFAISCPNYAQWMTRYHLELLYSDEGHPTACAMLETGAMSI